MSALPIETKELETRVNQWPDRAREIVITDDKALMHADDFLSEIKALRREVDSTFDPIIKRQLEAHREAIAQKRRHETPLADAERIIKASILGYQQEQRRIREEERRRLEAEARKREEERRLQEALELEEAGETDAAEELISEPIVTAPVAPLMPAPPKIAAQIRTTWSAEVSDFHELVKFVAANPSFLHLLSADMPSLNQYVRKVQAACNIPGVRAVQQQVVAGGRR